MKLEIKFRHLNSLLTWLKSLSLAGRESRERTRFIEVCLPYIKQVEEKRFTLIKENCELNEKGEPQIKDEKFLFKEGGQDKSNRDWNAFLDTSYTDIDIKEGNHAKVKTVRDLVLNTDQKFEGKLAEDYDKWAEVFEKLEL